MRSEFGKRRLESVGALSLDLDRLRAGEPGVRIVLPRRDRIDDSVARRDYRQIGPIQNRAAAAGNNYRIDRIPNSGRALDVIAHRLSQSRQTRRRRIVCRARLESALDSAKKFFRNRKIFRAEVAEAEIENGSSRGAKLADL